MDEWDEIKEAPRGRKTPVEERAEESVYASLLRSWTPIKILLENGVGDREIEIVYESIASTLEEHGRAEEGSSICEELEEFLADVLEEFALEMDRGDISRFAKKVVAEHNALVSRR